MKWSNWKYRYSRIRVFSVWPLPKVENWFFKADLKWKCPYFYTKFFLERFGQYLKKRKNGFSILFSKCDLAGWDTFFHRNFFLKKPNTSECAQVLVVTWVKLDCVEALLSPDPIGWGTITFSLPNFNFHKSCQSNSVLGFVELKHLKVSKSPLFCSSLLEALLKSNTYNETLIS